MMKVSVIMPAYNREAYVAAAIRSLLAQRADADLDIIVVDDGSTDGTADIVAEMSAHEPCIRLFREAHGGVGRARNTGLRNIAADADFVTFLDSDDISVRGRFAVELPLFAKDPDLALTYSMMTLADAVDDDKLEMAPHAMNCTVRGLSLTTSIFRKHAIEKVGPFDEAMPQAEDWDFLIRFFEQGWKYELVDNIAIIYRRHATNTTRDKANSRRYFMQAVLRSAQRRRIDPSIAPIPRFFDLTPLFDAQFASLR